MVDYKYRSPWDPDAFIAELHLEPHTVHRTTSCDQDPHCAIHKPSDHHMRSWPATWRSDTGLIERICEHGVGHPDPDSLAWLRSLGRSEYGVHGCCINEATGRGCCSAPG